MLKSQGMCYYCGKTLPEPGHTHLPVVFVRDRGTKREVLRYVCTNCRVFHKLKPVALNDSRDGHEYHPEAQAKVKTGHRQGRLFS